MPVTSPPAPIHAYRALLGFALKSQETEIALIGALAGKPHIHSDWIPHFRECESALKSLVRKALTVENITQFHVTEVERRIRALERSCLDMLLWPRDAKGKYAEYLIEQFNKMMATSWPELETVALQAEETSKRPAIPGCTGCGSQPAAIDVDDVCPTCGEYIFRCGQKTVPTDGDPEIIWLHAPTWERLPPSKVQKPAINPRKGESGPLAKKTPKKSRRRKSRVAELLLVLLEDRRNANLNCSELAQTLKCSVSAVSRAFRHKEYGPKIMKIYRVFSITPPGIHQI